MACAAEVGVGTVYRHFATAGEPEEAPVLHRFAEIEALAERSAPAGADRFLHDAIAVLAADELFAEAATRPTPALRAAAAARGDAARRRHRTARPRATPAS